MFCSALTNINKVPKEFWTKAPVVWSGEISKVAGRLLGVTLLCSANLSGFLELFWSSMWSFRQYHSSLSLVIRYIENFVYLFTCRVALVPQLFAKFLPKILGYYNSIISALANSQPLSGQRVCWQNRQASSLIQFLTNKIFCPFPLSSRIRLFTSELIDARPFLAWCRRFPHRVNVWIKNQPYRIVFCFANFQQCSIRRNM